MPVMWELWNIAAYRLDRDTVNHSAADAAHEHVVTVMNAVISHNVIDLKASTLLLFIDQH